MISHWSSCPHSFYPLEIVKRAIQAMAMEIVSFPSYEIVMFQNCLHVLPEGKSHKIPWKTTILLWFSHGFPIKKLRFTEGTSHKIPWKNTIFLWFTQINIHPFMIIVFLWFSHKCCPTVHGEIAQPSRVDQPCLRWMSRSPRGVLLRPRRPSRT